MLTYGSWTEGHLARGHWRVFVECPPANFTLKVDAIIRYGVRPKWIRIESYEMSTLCLDRLKLLGANLTVFIQCWHQQ